MYLEYYGLPSRSLYAIVSAAYRKKARTTPTGQNIYIFSNSIKSDLLSQNKKFSSSGMQRCFGPARYDNRGWPSLGFWATRRQMNSSDLENFGNFEETNLISSECLGSWNLQGYLIKKEGLLAGKESHSQTLSLLIGVLIDHCTLRIISRFLVCKRTQFASNGGRASRRPSTLLGDMWDMRSWDLEPSRLLPYKGKSWVLLSGWIFSLSYGKRVGSGRQ